MTDSPLSDQHLRQLAASFHVAAEESSRALHQWLSTPLVMSIEDVQSCPLADVSSLLGRDDESVCACVMSMQGTLTGLMLLAFDDASGLLISDLLLDKPVGTATSWNEVARSAVLETMNIAGSAYLNGIARDLSQRSGQRIELIPSPPVFLRDYAASLMQSAFMDQAISGSLAVFAQASFQRPSGPLKWTFLLVPDAVSLQHVADILSSLDS